MLLSLDEGVFFLRHFLRGFLLVFSIRFLVQTAQASWRLFFQFFVTFASFHHLPVLPLVSKNQYLSLSCPWLVIPTWSYPLSLCGLSCHSSFLTTRFELLPWLQSSSFYPVSVLSLLCFLYRLNLVATALVSAHAFLVSDLAHVPFGDLISASYIWLQNTKESVAFP